MCYEKVVVFIDWLVRLCGRVLARLVQRDESSDE